MLLYLKRVIVRDLEGLRDQLHAYPEPSMMWIAPPGVTNSSGTLALHMVGNLQHFIGALLGGTGYERDRPGEFGDRDVPLSELDSRIDAAIVAVSETLDGLTEADISAVFPFKFGELEIETGQFLVHLTAHLSYHLGQIDYHRRLTTGENTVAGSGQIAAIATSTSFPAT